MTYDDEVVTTGEPVEILTVTFTDRERAVIRERMSRLGMYAAGCIGAAELGRVKIIGDGATDENADELRDALLGPEPDA